MLPDAVGATIQQGVHDQAARLLVASVVVPEGTQSPQDALKVLHGVDAKPVFQGHAPRDLDALVGLLMLRVIHAPVLATLLFVASTAGPDWEAVYVLLLSNATQRAVSVDMQDGSVREGTDLENDPLSFFPRIAATDNREIAVFHVPRPVAESPPPAAAAAAAAPPPTPTPTPVKAAVPKKKKRPATATEESAEEKTNVG